VTDGRWYRDGLRFECSSCGACCRTHGDYAFVFLADFDVVSMAAYLQQETVDFLNAHCKTDRDGWTYLTMTEGDCNFLKGGNRCAVYQVRPKQCEAWPFWTENLDEETWNGPVRETCPGVGRGPLYSADEIDEIARDRDEWYGIG
jgi:uncharacterized protein